MKRLFFSILFVFNGSLLAVSDINVTTLEAEKIESKQLSMATRGDIKVLEASENIRYLSQKIVKHYLFFYKFPRRLELKDNIESLLMTLNDDFRIIVTTTKDSDTKDILDFLAYSKDQILQILQETPNEENAALMLDYSEILLEGADSIASTHSYNFSNEEKMLMVTKEMEYLLERMGKYYMALNVGFKSTTQIDALQSAITAFEEKVEKVNVYPYPDNLGEVLEEINTSWKINRSFLLQYESLFIPKLLSDSIENLENVIMNIALYHSKNQ